MHSLGLSRPVLTVLLGLLTNHLRSLEGQKLSRMVSHDGQMILGDERKNVNNEYQPVIDSRLIVP